MCPYETGSCVQKKGLDMPVRERGSRACGRVFRLSVGDPLQSPCPSERITGGQPAEKSP